MVEALLVFNQHIHALLQYLIFLQQFQDQFGYILPSVLRFRDLCDQFRVVNCALYAFLVARLEHMVDKLYQLHQRSRHSARFQLKVQSEI